MFSGECIERITRSGSPSYLRLLAIVYSPQRCLTFGTSEMRLVGLTRQIVDTENCKVLHMRYWSLEADIGDAYVLVHAPLALYTW